MERVQFQQEQMLAELKDLEQKGLFSHTEIKSIMKKRTAFESALVRRIPKKGDFLRYVAYEMGLEALRRRRVKRLNLPAGVPSISDFALVRRQFHIFERALRKFKADVALWVQYIELAKREGARALVGRISARALQLHPNTPALYVFAAQHELENLSPAAARSLLQRGIRLNKESVPLWTEYIKFELGFVEGLRRRWDVLGVQGEDAEEDVSEEARKEIMQGAIAKAVISEAAKAIPQLALFRALHALVSTYPTPLRADLLEYLHEQLVCVLPADPEALKLHAGRFLPVPDASEKGFTEELHSETFVDNLRAANEELLEKAREHCGAVSAAYAEFVQEWFLRDIGINLRLYLIACLQAITCLPDAAPRALAIHLRLLGSDLYPSPLTPEKMTQRARKYTNRAAGSAEVWIARLDVEAGVRGAQSEEVRRVWGEARRRVESEDVWMWGLRADAKDVCEDLLKESMAVSSVLHTTLLVYYVTKILHPADSAPPPRTRLTNLRNVRAIYLTTPRFLAAAFSHEAGLMDAAEAVLEEMYEDWRRHEGEAVEAKLVWAGWLLGRGAGERAGLVVAREPDAEEGWGEILEKYGTRA